MKGTERSGFTLLELLIVVIIVAILAAAALPQFSRMMTRSRTSEALGVIDSIMTAEMAYYQENAAFATFTTNGMAATALGLDLPADVSCAWDYSVNPGGTTNPIIIIASGDVAGAATNVIRTGTLGNDGARTLPAA